MSFVSLKFIVFVLGILILYYVIPQKGRKYVILGANIFFYALAGKRNLLILLGMVCISYVCAVLIRKNKNKYLLAGGVIVSVLPLLIFKYSNFGISILNSLLGGEEAVLAGFELIEPLGISFFSFKMISYLVDSYQGTISEKHDIVDYTVYVSFFPTIASGPIDRAEAFIAQLKKAAGWNYERFATGFLMTLYGYFQKMVIADRLNFVVNSVFNNYQSYSGFVLLVTSVFYSIQIYLDFAGYTYIVSGIAYAMGIKVNRNFEQPYFALSIKEFWQRWHISLSSWLRDYVYIPLGGNRKGTVRKYANLMITFLVSGLWHGAGWNYIVWGALHGFYQIVEDLLYKSVLKKIKLPCCVKRVVTFLLVNFAWIVFWANGDLEKAVNIISSMGKTGMVSFQFILDVGISNTESIWLLIGIIIVFVIDYLKNSKVDVIERFFRLNIVGRYMILYFLLFAVILLGYYGPGYNAAEFIYFQF